MAGVSPDPTKRAEALGGAVLYPFTNIGPELIFGLALLTAVPHAGWVSLALSLLFAVRVIRSSVRGKPEMPGWPKLAQAKRLLRLWLEAWVVTLIVLWPITLIVLVGTMQRFETADLHVNWIVGPALLLGLAAMFFYPGCLAVVALGNGIVAALTPARVRAVRGGPHGMFGISIVAFLLGGFVQMIVGGLLGKIPYAGPVLASGLFFWWLLMSARVLGLTVAVDSDPDEAE